MVEPAGNIRAKGKTSEALRVDTEWEDKIDSWKTSLTSACLPTPLIVEI